MPQPSDNLVFDRTAEDVARAKQLTDRMYAGTATAAERAEWLGGPKGTWDYEDLNRIEAWTTYLRDLLAQYGYTAHIVPKSPSEWSETDFLYRTGVDRIRQNVDALQTGFASLPDWRTIVYDDTVDYDQANALEWDLQRLYVWLQTMVEASYIKQAGTLFAVAGGVFNG